MIGWKRLKHFFKYFLYCYTAPIYLFIQPAQWDGTPMLTSAFEAANTKTTLVLWEGKSYHFFRL